MIFAASAPVNISVSVGSEARSGLEPRVDQLAQGVSCEFQSGLKLGVDWNW